jgi:hypothetical protein
MLRVALELGDADALTLVVESSIDSIDLAIYILLSS